MKNSVTRHIGRGRFFAMAREMKWAVERALKKGGDPLLRVAHLQPRGSCRGNVLLSRPNDAFFVQPGGEIPNSHHRFFEVFEMAAILVEMGFAVDVIHHRNQSFIPEKEYSLFLDSKRNMERIAPLLGADCKKIFYVVTAHPAFHNLAELQRLFTLQQRKGASLTPRRQEQLNRGIEHADCAIVRGNEFTMNTYRYAEKPLHWIPLAPRNLFPWPETKDFEQCRNHFLWFGGAGMVHKGLDLVLECFAKMPECQLTVCGPVEAEQDFVAAYHRELYDLPNVHLAGWMDVDRPEFLDIANRCVAVIHPSCSEAGGGAVITCVHAGLIPIVSYESSVNVDPDWGIVMDASSVEEIQQSVFRIAHLSPDALRGMARSAWEYERANHTMENYRRGFRRVISQVADGKKQHEERAEPSAHSSAKPASSDFAGGLHVA